MASGSNLSIVFPTYQEALANFAALRAYNPAQAEEGDVVIVNAGATLGDTLGGGFILTYLSTAGDDNSTVLESTAIAGGRWIRAWGRDFAYQSTIDDVALLNTEVDSLDSLISVIQGNATTLAGRTTSIESRTTALEGRTSAYLGLTVDTGTGRAQVSLHADSTGDSNIDLLANSIRLINGSSSIPALTVSGGNATFSGKVAASGLAIAQRGLVVTGGLKFAANATGNTITWTAGTLSYLNALNVPTAVGIAAGSAVKSGSNAVYIYWPEGTGTFLSGTANAALADGKAHMATYEGGANFSQSYGGTAIDGSTVTTGTLYADRIVTNSLSYPVFAPGALGNAVINYYAPATVCTSQTTWTDMASITYTSVTGCQLVGDFSGDITDTSDDGTYFVYQIVRGTTAIKALPSGLEWYARDKAATFFVNFQDYIGAGQTATWKLQMRKTHTSDGLRLYNATANIRELIGVTVSVSTDTGDSGGTGGGGSGGGSSCVYVGSYLPHGGIAGVAQMGDPLFLLKSDDTGVYEGGIEAVRFGREACYRLTTQSGITLVCSVSTPITTRDGATVALLDSVGVAVPVLDRDDFRWEEIVELEAVGELDVALISADDGTYAAGEYPDRYILTHNVGVKV